MWLVRSPTSTLQPHAFGFLDKNTWFCCRAGCNQDLRLIRPRDSRRLGIRHGTFTWTFDEQSDLNTIMKWLAWRHVERQLIPQPNSEV